MIKMEQEVVDLLKELVGRLQSLERTVYDNDNLLMKSGLVRVNTPTPGISHNSSDGLDSDAIHSPNEHYGIFNYFRGIETIPLFYKYFTDLKKNV